MFFATRGYWAQGGQWTLAALAAGDTPPNPALAPLDLAYTGANSGGVRVPKRSKCRRVQVPARTRWRQR